MSMVQMGATHMPSRYCLVVFRFSLSPILLPSIPSLPFSYHQPSLSHPSIPSFTAQLPSPRSATQVLARLRSDWLPLSLLLSSAFAFTNLRTLHEASSTPTPTQTSPTSHHHAGVGVSVGGSGSASGGGGSHHQRSNSFSTPSRQSTQNQHHASVPPSGASVAFVSSLPTECQLLCQWSR